MADELLSTSSGLIEIVHCVPLTLTVIGTPTGTLITVRVTLDDSPIAHRDGVNGSKAISRTFARFGICWPF